MPQQFKYVLIGGYSALNAAKIIRTLDVTGSILLVTKEEFLPYDRPPLSKQLLWDENFSALDALTQPNEFYAENRINLQISTEVTRIDREAKIVTLKDGETIPYDRLLLASGAMAKIPDLPSAESTNVHTIRNLHDSLKLREGLRAARQAIVVGGSYLGLECASGCVKRGVEVTVIDSHDGPWSKFASPQLKQFLVKQYENQGVKFLFNERIEKLNVNGGKAESVETSRGALPCDLVILATGAKLNSDLAKDTGLDVDEKFGIVVNEHYQTSDPHIWASGDCIHYPDPVVGKMWHNEHYTNAQWSGEIAGANMTGAKRKLEKAPYFFSDFLDFHMVFRGNPAGGKSKRVLGSMDAGEFVELYADDEDTIKMALAITHNQAKSDRVAQTLETLVLDKEKTANVKAQDLGDFFA